LIKEIQLFDGAIYESCGLKRSVVAVVMDEGAVLLRQKPMDMIHRK
jgi:hypothetical protein